MALAFHLQQRSATVHGRARPAAVRQPWVGAMVQQELDERQTLKVVGVSAVVSWVVQRFVQRSSATGDQFVDVVARIDGGLCFGDPDVYGVELSADVVEGKVCSAVMGSSLFPMRGPLRIHVLVADVLGDGDRIE